MGIISWVPLVSMLPGGDCSLSLAIEFVSMCTKKNLKIQSQPRICFLEVTRSPSLFLLLARSPGLAMSGTNIMRALFMLQLQSLNGHKPWKRPSDSSVRMISQGGSRKRLAIWISAMKSPLSTLQKTWQVVNSILCFDASLSIFCLKKQFFF